MSGWLARRKGPAGRLKKQAEALSGPLELVRAEDAGAAIVLRGRYRGIPYQLDLNPGGNCWIRVPLQASLPPGLHLSREPGQASAREKSDLQVGDAELDRLLRIEAANPAAALRLLRRSQLKAPLLALFAHEGAQILEGEIRVGPWQEATPELLRPAVAAACLAASVLDPSAEALARAHADQVARVRQEEATTLDGRRFVALAPVEELRWIQTFERARTRVWGIGLPLLLIGATGAVLGKQNHWPWDGNVGFAVAVLAMGVLRWFGTCPACRRELHGLRLWLSRERQSCPRCGVRLR